MGTDGELTPIGEQIEKLIQYLVEQAGQSREAEKENKSNERV